MSKRPQPRPTSTGAGGTAGPSGPGSSYGGSGSTPTATHILASAIALPPQTGLVRLQSQLTEMARQVTPFVQREVFCQRMDDEDETRKAVEQDAMYAPIRRARLQSRLRLRFERSKVDLRLYSKPNGKGLDSMDLYNLVCVPLECQSETTSQRKRASTAKDALLAEIDAGANEWKQIVRAMGWEPHSTLVRRGHRFVLRDDPACRVEAQLFQLYKIDDNQSTLSLERVSDTNVLQVTATLPLLAKSSVQAESSQNLDASQSLERAQTEITSVQDALRGLVEMIKEEE